jgi:hypothetical protein
MFCYCKLKFFVVRTKCDHRAASFQFQWFSTLTVAIVSWRVERPNVKTYNDFTSCQAALTDASEYLKNAKIVK